MKKIRTCEDFEYTGVKCCPSCHDYSAFELVEIKIDGRMALVCCALRSFFYPENPGIGLTPEEKLLRAIFGEKTVHDPDEEND